MLMWVEAALASSLLILAVVFSATLAHSAIADDYLGYYKTLLLNDRAMLYSAGAVLPPMEGWSGPYCVRADLDGSVSYSDSCSDAHDAPSGSRLAVVRVFYSDGGLRRLRLQTDE